MIRVRLATSIRIPDTRAVSTRTRERANVCRGTTKCRVCAHCAPSARTAITKRLLYVVTGKRPCLQPPPTRGIVCRRRTPRSTAPRGWSWSPASVYRAQSASGARVVTRARVRSTRQRAGSPASRSSTVCACAATRRSAPRGACSVCAAPPVRTKTRAPRRRPGANTARARGAPSGKAALRPTS